MNFQGGIAVVLDDGVFGGLSKFGERDKWEKSLSTV